MKRKVIKQGHNTLTITLPTKWCQRVAVKEGDEIEIDERDDTLLIDANAKDVARTANIRSNDLERVSTAKVISACYELGFDKIMIELGKEKTKCWYFGEEDFVATVDYFTERLVGFEITSHTEKKLTIENLSEPLLKFKSIISSLFSIIIEGIQNYVECLETKCLIKRGSTMQNEGEIRHSNISRFTSLGWRIIYKYHIHNKAMSLNSFAIIHHLDKAGDFLRFVYRDPVSDKKDVNMKLVKLARRCIEYIEVYRSFYTTYDIRKVNRMEEIRGEIKNMLKDMKKEDEIRIAGHLEAIVECFYGCIKPTIMIEMDRQANPQE